MIRIEPSPPIQFRGSVPGDKSISHRALILSALAEGETVISGLLRSADTEATWRCLAALGGRLSELVDGTVRVSGSAGHLLAPASSLYAANSGTTARLLLGVLAGGQVSARLEGDRSLSERPMDRVVTPLRAAGARIEELGTPGRLPLAVRPARLVGGRHTVPVASAQVKSALLLSGLMAEGRTAVELPAATRDHTERMLARFGVEVEREVLAGGETVALVGPRTLRSPAALAVPGDPSTAAFLWAAAAITGGQATVEGVCLNQRRIGFLGLLREMGVAVSWQVEREELEPVGSVTVAGRPSRAADVPPEAVADMIDELPLLACVMAVAPGQSRVSGAGELRVKESDRIAAMAEGLCQLGVACEATEDGWRIQGGPRVHGGEIDAHGDHRVGMALAVLALAGEEASELAGGPIWQVSYPSFLSQLVAAGGRAQEI